MQKETDEATEEEIVEWYFPQVEMPFEETSLQQKAEIIAEEQLNANKAKELEIAALLTELSNKIALLNSIIVKAQKYIDKLDEELIGLLQEIVKKAVKHFVYQTLDTDPDVINTIINELKALIQERNGLLTVFLSESDFQQLQKFDLDQSLLAKVDPKLHQGDFIIKSNSAEVHAILNDRLDKIMEISAC